MHFPTSISPHQSNPFCREGFFESLQNSGTIGQEQGWTPIYFIKNQSVLPSFLKSHSYGEYIFDWQWAQIYEKYGRSYYPKLLHALPFTPVNAPKVWGGEESQQHDLILESFEFYQKNHQISGEHYLFIDQSLSEKLKKLNFFTMYSMQYHWKRDPSWYNFDDFLSSLKKSRKKMIKKERHRVQGYGLKIEWRDAEELDVEEKIKIYNLYLQTIEKKNSYAYLNEKFFSLLFNKYPNDVKILLAYKDDNLCAMSLFMSSRETLFGRYWGIDAQYEQEYPLLHFEMCYYSGMDLCLEKGIKTFEAGAQGEHKLWRGFHPVKILSSHNLRDPDFAISISGFIEKQNEWQIQQIEQFKLYLPYARLE